MGIESDIELGSSSNSNTAVPPSSGLRQRKKRKMNDGAPAVASRPFAGRIGGNLEFTVSPNASDFGAVTSKAPDAAANFSWRESFALKGCT